MIIYYYRFFVWQDVQSSLLQLKTRGQPGASNNAQDPIYFLSKEKMCQELGKVRMVFSIKNEKILIFS